MPELPEVELFKQYLDQTSLHQKVSKIEVLNAKVLDSPEREFKTLVGKALHSTRRWGKNLFVKTDGVPELIMHFGMTGLLEYYHHSLETPKYSRVIFQFEGGFNLAYVSKRMFGRVGLISGIDEYINGKSLAKDALEISEQEFVENVKKRKKNIKAVLLDQGTAAGVGNWIADEILYQARIHPSSHSRGLTDKQINIIYHHMRDIITTAITGGSVREDLPSHYITKYGRKTNISCPQCRNDIEKTVVAGRGTYACSHCQTTF